MSGPKKIGASPFFMCIYSVASVKMVILNVPKNFVSHGRTHTHTLYVLVPWAFVRGLKCTYQCMSLFHGRSPGRPGAQIHIHVYEFVPRAFARGFNSTWNRVLSSHGQSLVGHDYWSTWSLYGLPISLAFLWSTSTYSQSIEIDNGCFIQVHRPIALNAYIKRNGKNQANNL